MVIIAFFKCFALFLNILVYTLVHPCSLMFVKPHVGYVIQGGSHAFSLRLIMGHEEKVGERRKGESWTLDKILSYAKASMSFAKLVG